MRAVWASELGGNQWVGKLQRVQNDTDAHVGEEIKQTKMTCTNDVTCYIYTDQRRESMSCSVWFCQRLQHSTKTRMSCVGE